MTAWASWRADYLDSLKGRGLSPATVRIRTLWLAVLERFCDRHRLAEPTAVTAAHLDAFAVCLHRYGPGTQRLAMASVRAFFRWALRTRRLLLDPTPDRVLGRGYRPSLPVLAPLQLNQLLAPAAVETAIQLRNRTVLETFYATAIRLGECHALDLVDVIHRDGCLQVRHGKGGVDRHVPLGPHLATVLDLYLADSRPHLLGRPGEPALFVARHGGRLSIASLEHIVRQAGRRIGLPTLGAHTLRRTCATHMLAAGADLSAVQAILGHASPDTTERYTQVTWAQIQAEHARTHPRAGRSPAPQS